MPWQNQGGGGPWGGGGGGRGPWSPGPSGGGSQPPNIEKMLRRGQERVKKMMPGGVGGARGLGLAALAVIGLWLASGLYRVEPDEQGIVMRFGEFVRTATPGLNYHLPTPIEGVLTPKVTRVNRTEIGFRSAEPRRTPQARGLVEESLMLTGDENIVDIQFVVLWTIKDASNFLFRISSPEQTVKAVAESAMREIVGQTPVQLVLSERRAEIEISTLKLLQNVLDTYDSGVLVTQVQLQGVDTPPQVVDAYRDVQRARADKERLRNEAEAYRNDIVPRARGEVAKVLQEAEAYRQETIARAQGDSERFISVYNSYRNAKDVTTRRLYLETMEVILRGVNKVIIDQNQGAQGVVPYLPLPEIQRRAAPLPAPGSAAPSALGAKP